LAQCERVAAPILVELGDLGALKEVTSSTQAEVKQFFLTIVKPDAVFVAQLGTPSWVSFLEVSIILSIFEESPKYKKPLLSQLGSSIVEWDRNGWNLAYKTFTYCGITAARHALLAEDTTGDSQRPPIGLQHGFNR
jgi:hypothetical protein